jgi:hypothetical protein
MAPLEPNLEAVSLQVSATGTLVDKLMLMLHGPIAQDEGTTVLSSS